MILFFDTETTGFYDDRLPPDHEAQPYIVQLAAQLCTDDNRAVAGFSFIVNPGVPIPVRASDVHGITDDVANSLGCATEFALTAFQYLYHRADLVVAHNVKFDRGVMEAAIARKYGRIIPLRKPLFCTMEAASPIVNLPPTDRMVSAGFTKPKTPKLAECIKNFFGEDLDGAHDAMVDLTACRRVYFHINAMEKAA